MSVFVNFNICDNLDECSGVEVCPTGALYWDAIKKSVVTDNNKCSSCGACVEACPAGAIRVAHNLKEEEQIKKDISNDPRTINDLMVERYGASPVSDSTMIDVHEAVAKIRETESFLAVEIIDDKSTPCMINSVPIAEVFADVAYEYHKVSTHDNEYNSFSEQYNITVCPTILVFRNNSLLVQVSGAVENRDSLQRRDFIHKIRSSIMV